MKEVLVIFIAGFLLDLLLGDPVYPFHPVRMFGKLISRVEAVIDRLSLHTLFGGVLLLFVVQTIVLGLYLLCTGINGSVDFVLNIFLVYSCIALSDLVTHGKRVWAALEANDLAESRRAVQMLIGRDAEYLDRYGVARATVESLAENFVDGFLAPLIWFLIGVLAAGIFDQSLPVGGISCLLLYRLTNTLDSMVGYRNDKYERFGKASAILDDYLNFVPARIAIPVFTIAAAICNLNWRDAWKIGWRDRLKHRSPNAGHAEACVAGALEIRLNGPGIYPFGKVDKPWVGSGTEAVTTDHLKKVFRLVICSAFITVILLVLLFALVACCYSLPPWL